MLGGQAADTKMHYEALKKMEFNVVVDLFPNPTTMAVADIILPAATIAEKESFRSWWSPLQVMMPAVQVGECRSDWEINLELAKRFNPELRKRYDTVKDLINDRLKPSGFTFDELKRRPLAVPGERHPHPALPPLRERASCAPTANRAFAPPPASWNSPRTSFKEFGMDPLPFFTEPPESEVRTPELAEKYPLVMVTGRRSPVFFHAEHRHDPLASRVRPRPHRGDPPEDRG